MTDEENPPEEEQTEPLLDDNIEPDTTIEEEPAEKEDKDEKPDEKQLQAVTSSKVIIKTPSEEKIEKKEEKKKKKTKKEKEPGKEKTKKKGKKEKPPPTETSEDDGPHEEKPEETEDKKETPEAVASPKKEKKSKEKKGKKKKSEGDVAETTDEAPSPSGEPDAENTGPPSKRLKKGKKQPQSEESPKKEKKKKKDASESDEKTEEAPKKEKKKKKKDGGADEIKETKKEKKEEVKKKKTPESDKESQEITEKKSKEKKKAQILLEDEVKKSESRLMGKRKSKLKLQTNQPSLVQLMSRLSLHHIQMEELIGKLQLFDDDSDDYSFSDESSEEESDEIPDEHQLEVKKKSASVVFHKKKKAKKDKEKKEKVVLKEPGVTESEEKPGAKKKKKAKKEKEEPEIEPQDDVLAEITRMKYLAEIQASGQETEEETETPTPKKKKKKKGPKKKLSKKEKARLAAEQAEKARQSAEEEEALAAERERIRLEEERRAAIRKEKREMQEQVLRMEQLETALEQMKVLVDNNEKLREVAKTQAEWEFFVNCKRLPNAGKCDQMNTFLHLWEKTVDETSMEEAARRTKDVLELLGDLDGLIDTANGKNPELLKNWKWVRLLFRMQQAKSLDVATYRLLRNIDQNLHRIDIPTADYKYQDENIVLCLWLRIQLPTPLPNPRRPAKPRIEVNFSQMKMEVQFPLSIDGEKTAVRALYVKYDHLSDLSNSYEKSPVPENYDIDLYDAIKAEWRQKLLYKFQNRVRKIPEPQEDQEEPPQPEPDPVFGPEDEIPTVPYRKLEPTASEYVISKEDELYTNIRNNLLKVVPDDVINLRKYSIIGGVYSLHLIHQPPQPQDFVTLEMNLTPLYVPKQLEFVDLYLDYDPPAPAEPGVRRPPEEIEEEMKKSEEELERLILVSLTWPEHVIFLELPMVCFWDTKRKVWSKEEVHDLKHNEEKGQLMFRTRMCGTFALAVYRHANLPYQAWELRPEANGSVSLQITAAILMVEFNVKGGVVALTQLQNSPNNALQDIIGIYFDLPKLVRVLQSAGVDVFPAFDAFCYVETTCEKHWPMEKRLYFNMAQLSICFNFAWSRWNMAAGRRNVVLQMREYNVEKTKQKSHAMLHVTPLHALLVDCTEVSQTFNEEGIEGMKFYPDLYFLVRGAYSLAVRNKVNKISSELVVALYELLVATRVVSFS